MELVGTYKIALCMINSIKARTVENIRLYTKDEYFSSTNEVVEKVENKYAQYGKTDAVMQKDYLFKKNKREKGRVRLSFN